MPIMNVCFFNDHISQIMLYGVDIVVHFGERVGGGCLFSESGKKIVFINVAYWVFGCQYLRDLWEKL